jgi:hypothetical protein
LSNDFNSRIEIAKLLWERLCHSFPFDLHLGIKVKRNDYDNRGRTCNEEKTNEQFENYIDYSFA